MTYEFEGKTEKDAIEKACSELGLESDQFDVEIIETQKKTLFKSGYVKIRVHTEEATPGVKYDETESVSGSVKRAVADPVPQGEFEEKLVTFVKEIISKMGYEAEVEVMFREERKIGLKMSCYHVRWVIAVKSRFIGINEIGVFLVYCLNNAC